MSLELLLKRMATDPNAIKLLEEEIERLASSADISVFYEAVQSGNPAVILYVCKALEFRIRRGVGRRALAPEIELANRLLREKCTYHVCRVYALLGLYCWPVEMPGFVDEVGARLGNETGYQILYMFVEGVNNNSEIDDKRRGELKKAVPLVMPGLAPCFTDEYAEYIIPIFTELTRIMPLNYDYSVVFRKAADFPELAVGFFVDSCQPIPQDSIVEVSERMPPNPNMLQLLVSFKPSKLADPSRVYAYLFRCIADRECFVFAVDFWKRIFNSREQVDVLPPVFNAVVKTLAQLDEEERAKAEPGLYDFFATIARIHSVFSIEFLKAEPTAIPTNFLANFLQKIAKVAPLPADLVFSGAYLNTLVAHLRKDPAVTSMLMGLNLADKEAVKLAISIVESTPVSAMDLQTLLGLCDGGCLQASELKVLCKKKLGIMCEFSGDWDMPKVIEFYYCLKRERTSYIQYRDSFFRVFMQKAPFDRCFSIVEMLAPVPEEILREIYEKIDKYPFIEILCFNNDLLTFLDPEIQLHFIMKEAARFISEWETMETYKDYYQAVCSLLTVMAGRIDHPGMVDLLVDLTVIDYFAVANRIASIFNSSRGKYNVHKAVHHFAEAYNSPNLGDSQAQLSAALTTCIYAEGGPEAFSEVLGLDIARCREARKQLAKVNRKTAQSTIRHLLKDFKGKAYHCLFKAEPIVTKQDFLAAYNKPVSDEQD